VTTLESIEEQVKELNRKLDLTQQLMVFTALASASSPVTSIAANFDGNLIGVTDRYQELYRNNYNRLVALRVTGEFAVPGSTASLSLSANPSNIDRVDILSSVGKVISDVIWLRPNQILYINTADVVFTLTGSLFRVRLFDPLSFL
jgi:hypothetical protein